MVLVTIDCSITLQTVIGNRLYLTTYPSYTFKPLRLWIPMGSDISDADYCRNDLDRWTISYYSYTNEIMSIESVGSACVIL